jgi:hypothetical protein
MGCHTVLSLVIVFAQVAVDGLLLHPALFSPTSVGTTGLSPHAHGAECLPGRLASVSCPTTLLAVLSTAASRNANRQSSLVDAPRKGNPMLLNSVAWGSGQSSGADRFGTAKETRLTIFDFGPQELNERRRSADSLN